MQIKLLLIAFLFTSGAYSQSRQIYSANDSTLTSEFVQKLCLAVVNKSGAENTSGPTDFENLTIEAAGTFYKSENQPQKVFQWWQGHYSELYCRVKRKKTVHISRLIVESDFREIANQIGPHGRLSIDLEIKDDKDSLTLLEFVKLQRESRTRKFNYETLKFQKDEKWKSYTYYMMLLTHYEVEWAVLRDDEDK